MGKQTSVYAYIGANGVLRESKNKIHRPIDGVKESNNQLSFSEVEDWTMSYNPFRGANLFNRK